VNFLPLPAGEGWGEGVQKWDFFKLSGLFVTREVFFKEKILFDPPTLPLSRKERGQKRHSAIALLKAYG
jgi:hypothetical protein